MYLHFTFSQSDAVSVLAGPSTARNNKQGLVLKSLEIYMSFIIDFNDLY